MFLYSKKDKNKLTGMKTDKIYLPTPLIIIQKYF